MSYTTGTPEDQVYEIPGHIGSTPTKYQSECGDPKVGLQQAPSRWSPVLVTLIVATAVTVLGITAIISAIVLIGKSEANELLQMQGKFVVLYI
jgi:hypothetical protein